MRGFFISGVAVQGNFRLLGQVNGERQRTITSTGSEKIMVTLNSMADGQFFPCK